MVYCVIGKEMTFGKDIDARARVCDQRKMWCAYKWTPKKKKTQTAKESILSSELIRFGLNNTFFPIQIFLSHTNTFTSQYKRS